MREPGVLQEVYIWPVGPVEVIPQVRVALQGSEAYALRKLFLTRICFTEGFFTRGLSTEGFFTRELLYRRILYQDPSTEGFSHPGKASRKLFPTTFQNWLLSCVLYHLKVSFVSSGEPMALLDF